MGKTDIFHELFIGLKKKTVSWNMNFITTYYVKHLDSCLWIDDTHHIFVFTK